VRAGNSAIAVGLGVYGSPDTITWSVQHRGCGSSAPVSDRHPARLLARSPRPVRSVEGHRDPAAAPPLVGTAAADLPASLLLGRPCARLSPGKARCPSTSRVDVEVRLSPLSRLMARLCLLVGPSPACGLRLPKNTSVQVKRRACTR
jgi:hypothetical protein